MSVRAFFIFSDMSTDGEGFIDWEVKTFIKRIFFKKQNQPSSSLDLTDWFAFQVEDTLQNWKYVGYNPKKKKKNFKNGKVMRWQWTILDEQVPLSS